MIHSKLPIYPYRRNIVAFRAMFMALAFLPVGCNQDDQQANKAPPAPPPAAQNMQPTTAPPPTPQTTAPPPAAQNPVLPPVPQNTPPTATPVAQPAMPQNQVMPGQPAPMPVANPLTDMESLVAPIALYPDPLLAELLVASTYPLEVVQAARWLETKPDMATLSTKDWDASIQRLASVPLVIKMLNDHLDWTTQLGDTFLAKPKEVMDTIQALRKRAKDAGFLKDTPEQKVTAQTVAVEQKPEAAGATQAVMKKEVITIAPAKADTIYVPQYSPEAAYQAPMAPSYAPTYYPSPSYYAAPAPVATTTTTTSYNSSNDWATLATGAVVGGLMTWGLMEWADDHDDWGYVGHYYGNNVCYSGGCWGGGGGYYGGGGGYYGGRGNNNNINIGNDVNIDRGGRFNDQRNLRPSQQPAGWRPDTRHRRGQPLPDAAQNRLKASQLPAGGDRGFGEAGRPGGVGGIGGAGAGALAGAGAGAIAGAAGRGLTAGTLPAGGRPSSSDIRQQLSQKPGARSNFAQNKPSTRDVQNQLGQGARNNAMQGMRNQGQASQLGLNNRQAANQAARQSLNRPSQAANRPNLSGQNQGLGGRGGASQQRAAQRRAESARPNAFESPRNGAATQNFSQRGAFSQGRAAGAGNFQAPGAGRGGAAGARGSAFAGGGGARGGGAARGGGGGARGGGGRRR